MPTFYRKVGPLWDLYQETGYFQGAKPESAALVILGKDANFKPEWHQATSPPGFDGYAHYKRHFAAWIQAQGDKPMHHPFLEGKVRHGRRYHAAVGRLIRNAASKVAQAQGVEIPVALKTIISKTCLLDVFGPPTFQAPGEHRPTANDSVVRADPGSVDNGRHLENLATWLDRNPEAMVLVTYEAANDLWRVFQEKKYESVGSLLAKINQFYSARPSRFFPIRHPSRGLTCWEQEMLETVIVQQFQKGA